MVDGVNNPKPATQHSTLKLKGMKKTIDLNNLAGLQKTQGNESLFKLYDKDGNGVIDQKEAYAMRNNLQSLAGNDTISKKEINKQFGKDTNAFEQLSKLADQQAAGVGKEYIETNGNTTTHLYRSAEDSKYNYQYTTTKNENGTTTTITDDGSQEIKHPDGSKQTITPDGIVTGYDSKGNKTYLIKNGETTTFTPDGTKSITKNSDGQTIYSAELRDGKEVYTKYEQQNGNTIAREYSSMGENAQLTGITVSAREKNTDGTTGIIETKFNSEEDMQNNRPTSELRNKGLPTETKTEYEYDSKGNKKIKQTGLDNITKTTFTDSKGNIINSEQFDAPQAYTVKKGDSITKIVIQALADQGITNPTPDQLKDAKQQFIEMNQGTVKTFKGKNGTKVKGFWPNDKVNIPNFKESITNVYLSEVTVTGTKPQTHELNDVVITAKKPSPETIAQRKELQAKLGNNYEVGYTRDGQIEIKDKSGNVLAQDMQQILINANTQPIVDNPQDIKKHNEFNPLNPGIDENYA